MTQEGFAAADRITATLDAACAALLGSRATHYPIDAFTAFRRPQHPAAKALFGLRISQIGPGLLSVPKLGTVIEVSANRRPNANAGREAVPVLTQRFAASALGLTDPVSVSALRLHAEPTPVDTEPLAGFTQALAALAEPRVTVAPDELSTGSGVEARLVVPPAFHTLTVRGSGNALSAHLTETAEELFSGASPAERNDFAVVAALLSEQFAASNVAYAGVATLLVNGRSSRVSLVVSTVPCAQPIQELAVELSTERPYSEVWTVLLPAGPAAVLVENRAMPALKELHDERPGGVVYSSVVEAFVPMPDGATVLTVQLTTSDTEDWDVYTSVFADLLCSVQLAWDGVAVAPAPVPVGRAVPAHSPAVPAQSAAPSVPVAPPVPVATPEQADAPSGTSVRVPPSDFNPFGAPAPADPRAQQPSPVLASADPFGAPAPAPVAPEEPAKGTTVRVPPEDFNPFGAPAPAAQAAAPAAPEPAPAADPFGAPAATPEPEPEAADPTKGRLVKIPPADFNPFGAAPTPAAATPAAPEPAAPAADPFGAPDPFAAADPFGAPTAPPTPAPEPEPEPEAADPTKGRLVKIPPADFNPFGAAPTPAAATPSTPEPATPAADPFGAPDPFAAADPFGAPTAPPTPAPAPVPEAADPTKGRLVKVPPADFNPFGAPAPAAATPSTEEPEAADPTKGRLVKVPPADFNPFGAASAPAAAAPAATPAPAPVAAPAPARAASADPFGTVLSSEPSDPFGTITGPPSNIPPRPSAPPAVPAPADPPEAADPTKGRLVKVPPADFNPFGAAAAPAAAAPAAEEPEEADPTKGRLVKVPPADYNPFGGLSAPPAPAAAPQSPPPPPANSPFG
ncbi:hypothetical protein ACFYS8_26290 [Kitasatospora sp. NPDC004615]|uniref:hypothetical protein n=1 Tax=Kitasatospora sp. NPDC004615 TaxID=3364017 RepID=UPI00367564CD